MIGILLSCAVTLPVSVESLTEYIQCRNDVYMIEYVEQWKPLVDKYFDTTDDKIQALKIIYCESRGKPNAKGLNKDGTYDIGLWQFNDNTWTWLKPKLKIKKKRTNPETATAVASWLIYNDGWHHWNASAHCWKDT